MKREIKETKFLEDAKSFRTPFKKRKGLEDVDDEEVKSEPKVVKFARHTRGLPPVTEVEELHQGTRTCTT